MAQLWAAKNDAKLSANGSKSPIKAEPNSIRVHLSYANWLLTQNEIPQAKIHGDTAAKIDANSTGRAQASRSHRPDQQRSRDRRDDFPAGSRTIRRPTSSLQSTRAGHGRPDRQESRSRALQLATVNAQANQRSAEALATLGYVIIAPATWRTPLEVPTSGLSPGQMAADTAYYLAPGPPVENKKPEDAVKVLDQALQPRGSSFTARNPSSCSTS